MLPGWKAIFLVDRLRKSGLHPNDHFHQSFYMRRGLRRWMTIKEKYEKEKKSI